MKDRRTPSQHHYCLLKKRLPNVSRFRLAKANEAGLLWPFDQALRGRVWFVVSKPNRFDAADESSACAEAPPRHGLMDIAAANSGEAVRDCGAPMFVAGMSRMRRHFPSLGGCI